MHMDLQQVIALGLVAIAAWAVGRRLLGQLQGFRAPRRSAAPKATKLKNAKTNPTPLVQIQLKPPAHLKRPPSDGP